VFAPARGQGFQVFSPFSIGVDYDEPGFKVESRVKGGYVYTGQRTEGQTASYTGPIDTQMSFNVVMLNFESVRPQVGVAMNLPTGTSYLPNAQRFTRIDPDLAMVGSYGVGFNVNPTAGFVVGLNQSTALSLSSGYAWQGKFVREGLDLNTPGIGAYNLRQYIEPGDVVTGNFNLTTEVGNTVVLGSFAYMSETAVEINGLRTGRAGARYSTNLTLNTQLVDRWSLVSTGSWSFAEKNDILIGSALATEPKNSNSHVVTGSLEPGYMLTERLRVAANYSMLWRDENFYDVIENQFSPAKIKHTAGASARYAVSQNASIEVRGGHSWIHQDASGFVPISAAPFTLAQVPPDLHYQAWMISTSANVRF
jgi:hypothetical protein